jgi:hypothetical protein
MFSLHLRQITGQVAALAIGLGVSGCSETVRQGQSPAYLIINQLEAASGADDESFSNLLASDVVTNGTIFEDAGRVTFALALKNIGSPGQPTAPTTNNYITVTRYRVEFRRTDGRNTPGVDVPYSFDGAGTVTVTESGSSMVFALVRAQAKLESPLKNLAGAGGAGLISTIADVTFYGKDQTGNDVAATGSISVNFADWGDPPDSSGGDTGGDEGEN